MNRSALLQAVFIFIIWLLKQGGAAGHALVQPEL